MSRRIDYLTDPARQAAERLVKYTGSMKIVLSAGLIALSKLTAEQREQMIAEANGILPEETEQPENINHAIRTVVQVMSGSGKKIEILPEEYTQLKEFIKETFGPKRKKA